MTDKEIQRTVCDFLRFQGLDFKPSSADRQAFNQIAYLISGLDPAIVASVPLDCVIEVMSR